jgi:NAD/NADP transhydrogenase beta subunit
MRGCRRRESRTQERGADMPPLTIYLSRLIGLSAVLIAFSMLADNSQALLTVTALAHDRPLLTVVGILGTVAGLAIVLSRQRWSGGDLPVVVTLIGWIILIRGAVLLF